MTEKRFTDDGIEEIENQSFTDNLTERTYWIDNGLDEIVELLNKLHEENEHLKQQLRKKYGVGGKMSECKDYGLKCLKCPYWNHWTNFCTKWKITTSTSGDL